MWYSLSNHPRYCSEQAHSSVEKACLIAMVKLRLVPVDDQLSLRGEALRRAIDKDKSKGEASIDKDKAYGETC